MTRNKPAIKTGRLEHPQTAHTAVQCEAPFQETDNLKSRPSLLFIMADQHRRDALGVAGDPVAITPNLDALAAQSTRFTKAYCTNPICAPSRASILTGLYSHHLGSSDNNRPFSPRQPTVAEHFTRAGYNTALIGKMHFVDAQTHGFQYKLEFNDWLQTLGPRALQYANETMVPNSGAGLPEIPSLWRALGDPWKEFRTPDGRLGPVAIGRPSDMVEEDHFESFVTRESIRFLESYGKASAEPFFLVSSFLKPHDPFMPAKRFATMFDVNKMPLSPTWDSANVGTLPKSVVNEIETSWVTPELLEAEHARQRVAAYYGNLMQTDNCVGQILDALTRLDLDRSTIIIYSSDHGEMLGDLGLWNKFQFYEGSCGVPLLVRIPKSAPAVCQTPVSLISLAATMGELCSVPLCGPTDGRSFADLIRNPSSLEERGPVFAEYDVNGSQEKYMILHNELKYTFWVHDRDELYDLRKDPQEMENLADYPEQQATVERLKKRLFAWYRPKST